MAIEFEFPVIRANSEGGESEITLYLECDVTTSYEEEGRSYFISVLSCTDDNGEDIDLTRREQEDVEDIAVDYVTGERQ